MHKHILSECLSFPMTFEKKSKTRKSFNKLLLCYAHIFNEFAFFQRKTFFSSNNISSLLVTSEKKKAIFLNNSRLTSSVRSRSPSPPPRGEGPPRDGPCIYISDELWAEKKIFWTACGREILPPLLKGLGVNNPPRMEAIAGAWVIFAIYVRDIRSLNSAIRSWKDFLH